MWDSRDREKHWTQKEWPIYKTLEAGTPNIVHDPIVSREKIVFPPLHIKLGLMKQFMKALDSDDECFQPIVSAFPKLLFDKIKAGVFDEPQIRTLVRDEEFVNKINDKEKTAWLSFVAVTQNFVGNKKTDNYHALVIRMLLAYCDRGYKMSSKLYFLYSHLDEFPSNPEVVSDEQGEQFYQDLMTMEHHYQGRWDINMMADYC